MASKRRLVIISYRLPFKLQQEGSKLQLVKNSGGLVSAILSFSEKLKELSLDHLFSEIAWVGYSDHLRSDFRRARYHDQLFELFPVPLEDSVNEKFYGGFSNNLLWPLLHYFPSYAVFDDSYFEHYEKANRIFCDAIMKMIRPDDIIWVHDYHFLLLPQMIRERSKKALIGFFLHIPFPSFEVFRLLPRRWREPIIKGMLGADLIGFHTLDYAYHFLKTVKNVLGIEHLNRQLSYRVRKIKTEAFPISIDFQKFRDATRSQNVINEIHKLREILKDQKLIFSVDRLDYTKGIINRLEAFDVFLKEHPEWRGRAFFNMVVIPSRDEIPQYQEMRNQIDAMVGRINSQYSTMGWRPILYQYKSLQFEELVALYDLSDVGLITPIRDGMNLVAKEYVASQQHKAGALILSEMAGAAAELQDAIIVNPTDKKEIADAILMALEMPEAERRIRMQRMQRQLQDYDVIDWTTDFVQQLNEVRKMNQSGSSNNVTPAVVRSIIHDYQRATKRILFLDYDGTLVSLQQHPELAVPDEELVSVLSQLGGNEKNVVVLISGRDKNFLEKWFGKLPITLVAEHGAFTKMPYSEWMHITSEDAVWKKALSEVLKDLTDRFPGSLIEVKEHGVAWHYRNAPKVTSRIVQELKSQFTPVLHENGLQLLEGSKVLEVKHDSFNKGTAVQQFLSIMKEAFMLAIGDDKTDEDLFRSLPSHAYTIKVGEPSTNARYYLVEQKSVLKLLKNLLYPQSRNGTPPPSRVER